MTRDGAPPASGGGGAAEGGLAEDAGPLPGLRFSASPAVPLTPAGHLLEINILRR